MENNIDPEIKKTLEWRYGSNRPKIDYAAEMLKVRTIKKVSEQIIPEILWPNSFECAVTKGILADYQRLHDEGGMRSNAPAFTISNKE